MAYTSNVPQGNQQIAATQAPILANFGFIRTGIGVEHNFNTAGSGSDMYHLQASMPNMADPGALLAGTNGVYYVNGGLPKYYNGTASFIQISSVPYNILTGTVALNTSPASVVTIPANSVGQYYLFKKGSNNTVKNSSAAGLFTTDNNSLLIARTQDFDPGISLSDSGRTLQAETTSSSFNGTYTYLIVYYNP